MATANKGAAIERGKLLAKLRRMRRVTDMYIWADPYNQALEDIAEWVRQSAERASKRPGGLGRKPKAMKAK